MLALRRIVKSNFISKIPCAVRLMSDAPQYNHVDNMSIDELFKREPYEKSDYVLYPNEKPGLNYKLNWSLCRADIVPWNDAWRNPDLKFLIEQCPSKPDAEGAIQCSMSFPKPEEVELDTKSDFEDLSLMVKKYLSGVPDLFVEDAGLGSARPTEQKIRTVTNDPLTALFMRKMGIRLPLRDPYLPQNILNVVARGYDDLFSCMGEDPNNGSYTVCFAGNVPFERMLSDLASAYRTTTLKPESPVLITGSLLYPKKGGLPSMVIGDHPNITSIAYSVGCLYGAHHVILHPSCSSRLWGGVYYPIVDKMINKVQKGDIVVDGKNVCSSFKADNAMDLPGTILFVDKEHSSNMSELSYDKAQEKFKNLGYLDAEIDKIIAIAKLGKIEFYELNEKNLEEVVRALA